MPHHRRGIPADAVVVSDLVEHIGQLVAVILGVQIRAADAARPHVQDQLPRPGLGSGNATTDKVPLHAADGLHPGEYALIGRTARRRLPSRSRT